MDRSAAIEGTWRVEVAGIYPGDFMTLTFADGSVTESGLPVGRYEHLEDNALLVTIGENVEITISHPGGDEMPATMKTLRHGVDADVVDSVKFVRQFVN